MALKYKVIRCVAYTIEIILLFILQELPYLMPSLLGVRPLLLIAAPMTIAILENEKIGLGFGVFAGLGASPLSNELLTEEDLTLD